MGNSAVGIRGFAGLTDFYGGGAGVMAGGNTDFGAIVLVSDAAPAAGSGLLFGNYNDVAASLQGWSILRTVDTAGPPVLSAYSVNIYGGAVTLPVTIDVGGDGSRGRLTWLAFTYVAATDQLNVYAQGSLVDGGTVAITPIASLVGPSIGGSAVLNAPASNNGVIAAAYFTDFDALTVGAALSHSFTESLKRADIVEVAGLEFTHLYSMQRNCGAAGPNGTGYPRTLTNYGSAGAGGDLDKQGVANFTVVTPPINWAAGFTG